MAGQGSVGPYQTAEPYLTADPPHQTAESYQTADPPPNFSAAPTRPQSPPPPPTGAPPGGSGGSGSSSGGSGGTPTQGHPVRSSALTPAQQASAQTTDSIRDIERQLVEYEQTAGMCGDQSARAGNIARLQARYAQLTGRPWQNPFAQAPTSPAPTPRSETGQPAPSSQTLGRSGMSRGGHGIPRRAPTGTGEEAAVRRPRRGGGIGRGLGTAAVVVLGVAAARNAYAAAPPGKKMEAATKTTGDMATGVVTTVAAGRAAERITGSAAAAGPAAVVVAAGFDTASTIGEQRAGTIPKAEATRRHVGTAIAGAAGVGAAIGAGLLATGGTVVAGGAVIVSAPAIVVAGAAATVGVLTYLGVKWVYNKATT